MLDPATRPVMSCRSPQTRGWAKVNQPAVAKLAQRSDVYVSSLRSYIEALGRKLKVIAEFPQGEVTITKFSEVGEDVEPS